MTSTNPEKSVANQWPRIGRFLRVDESTGSVEDDFIGWCWQMAGRLSRDEQAAGYEEWADFWEWCLARRATELTDGDWRLAAQWTDSMVYLCRRAAVWARDGDPGPWVHQHVRRPDLDDEGPAHRSRCAGP